jgi:hypothetical protein
MPSALRSIVCVVAPGVDAGDVTTVTSYRP